MKNDLFYLGVVLLLLLLAMITTWWSGQQFDQHRESCLAAGGQIVIDHDGTRCIKDGLLLDVN